MNALWEQLSSCKEKIKELETKLDSANKEISQLKDKLEYIAVCAVQKEGPRRSLQKHIPLCRAACTCKNEKFLLYLKSEEMIKWRGAMTARYA